ncbi:MAG: 50S ribosomal protein L17 [Chloroflexi bacterium]|nr:50S ribosomal protein L17 [Chloroflexota bacterium]
MDGRKLGRDTAHRRAMFRNQVTDLLRYEKLTTTEAKAKEIQGMAEKVITLGKRGDLPARRRALAFVLDEKVVDKVFSELGGRYAQRPGGYTRLTRLGTRVGDGATLARLELMP